MKKKMNRFENQLIEVSYKNYTLHVHNNNSIKS